MCVCEHWLFHSTAHTTVLTCNSCFPKGYEWNKYNQTHYDHDNPPPKIVQGYKFNVCVCVCLCVCVCVYVCVCVSVCV